MNENIFGSGTNAVIEALNAANSDANIQGGGEGDVVTVPPNAVDGLQSDGNAGGSTNIPQGTENPPQPAQAVQEYTPATPALDVDALKTELLDGMRGILQGNQATVPQDIGNLEQQTETEPQLIDIESEDFLEKFADNPGEAIRMVADQIADHKVKAQMEELTERMKPVLEQSDQLRLEQEAQGIFQEFMSEYPDASDYADDIAALITERSSPLNSKDSFVNAYKDAKIKSLEGRQGKTLDEYLEEDDSVQQLLQNDDIKSKIINEYLQELSNGKQPQVITSGGSATPPAQSPNNPETFEDARKSLLSKLNRR